MELVEEGAKTKDELARGLAQTMVAVSNYDEAGNLLEVLLTPTERENLGKRIEILKLLRCEASYQEVKRVLGSTDNTIAKMSNLLKETPPGFLRFLDELIRQDLLQKGASLQFTSAGRD